MSERQSKVTHYSHGIDGVMIVATGPSGEGTAVLKGSAEEAMEEMLDKLAAFDSAADTLRHIRRVQHLLGEAAAELIRRGTVHDDSKLGPEEKPHFDRETPLLKGLTFNSPEYKESLGRLGEALRHHYANNSHHPEHYENGVAGMDVFDLIEMVMDWKAASERIAGNSINLEAAFERFEVDPQLASIIRNTATRLGWKD